MILFRIIFLIVCCVFSICFVFFFKQKTAYEMRISDWSSDVCSSDLWCDNHLAPEPWRRGIDRTAERSSGRCGSRTRRCDHIFGIDLAWCGRQSHYGCTARDHHHLLYWLSQEILKYVACLSSPLTQGLTRRTLCACGKCPATNPHCEI